MIPCRRLRNRNIPPFAAAALNERFDVVKARELLSVRRLSLAVMKDACSDVILTFGSWLPVILFS
jgi:hypothetical protein